MELWRNYINIKMTQRELDHFVIVLVLRLNCCIANVCAYFTLVKPNHQRKSMNGTIKYCEIALIAKIPLYIK